MPKLGQCVWTVIFVLSVSLRSVSGTWSLVLTNDVTGEIGLASATCIAGNFDLKAITPVVVPGIGAALCQAGTDYDGIRRPILREGFLNNSDPSTILASLAAVEGHASRQYGIGMLQHDHVTFTGFESNAWAGGVVGAAGRIKYDIQGNILAGDCVVRRMEQYVRQAALADISIPDIMMVAMEIAQKEGGDGRCSCASQNPTGCGCPPESFTKSSHTAFMIYTLPNDQDNPQCGPLGCAEGNYYLDLNVAFQASTAPDPVVTLRMMYDDWQKKHSILRYQRPGLTANTTRE